ncbi:AAA family ATPase [Alteromonas macleodii]|jgi:hypothetical protein|uniref:AAA family ATPase n=1 Tax=Alteromonas macleodii TaxID=28108 RepID=UPI0024A7B1EC|nr:AAA family ATPase [Alteromonas macleodii]|tara:strand:- start:67286 stop:68317 length:1032 start_codon:yes stop_codon:yes gene_type:complete
MNNVQNINARNKVNLKAMFPECGFKKDIVIEIPTNFPSHLQVPSCDPHYQPDTDVLINALMWLVRPNGRSIWCFGPPGTGKTELWHFICSRIGLPMLVLSATPDTQTDKLQGKFVLRNKGDGVETEFDLAAVADAMKHGVFCLLDEGDKLGPDTAASLHRVAEMKPWLIEDTKEVVHPGEWFRLAVCANTNGREANPAFPSSRVQDDAFLDRFNFITFDYLKPSKESEIIAKAFPMIGMTTISTMLTVANALRDATLGPKVGRRRDASRTNGITALLTFRGLKSWADQMVKRGFEATLEDCLETAFLAGLDSQTYVALMGDGGILRKVAGDALSKTPKQLEGK